MVTSQVSCACYLGSIPNFESIIFFINIYNSIRRIPRYLLMEGRY